MSNHTFFTAAHIEKHITSPNEIFSSLMEFRYVLEELYSAGAKLIKRSTLGAVSFLTTPSFCNNSALQSRLFFSSAPTHLQ